MRCRVSSLYRALAETQYQKIEVFCPQWFPVSKLVINNFRYYISPLVSFIGKTHNNKKNRCAITTSAMFPLFSSHLHMYVRTHNYLQSVYRFPSWPRGPLPPSLFWQEGYGGKSGERKKHENGFVSICQGRKRRRRSRGRMGTGREERAYFTVG